MALIPDEPILDERQKKRAMAGEAITDAALRGQFISDEGGVPLFTNIPQGGKPVDEDTVYIPQQTMQDYNPPPVGQKPTEKDMTITERLAGRRKEIIKNILENQDPMAIDPNNEADTAAWSYLKSKEGMFGKVSDADKAIAEQIRKQTLIERSQKKSELNGVLAQAMAQVQQHEERIYQNEVAEKTRKEAEILEQKRHERNLAEKKAASGYIEPIKETLPKAEPGKVQEAAIADLQPGQQNVVKKLVNYEIPLPSGMALRTPYWQGILERAASYDPSFDVSQYNVRMSLRRSFNNGKEAANIRSANTLVGHLESMAKTGEALENVSIPLIGNLYNKAKNKFSEQSGNPKVDRFLAAVNAVSSELASVFKGSGGVAATDQEIKEWRNRISEAKSPEQIRGFIEEAAELMKSRLDALRGQYETGMGKPKDFTFIHPKARKALERLGIDISDVDKGANNEIRYVDNGKEYLIPPDKEAAFLKSRPNAIKR